MSYKPLLDLKPKSGRLKRAVRNMREKIRAYEEVRPNFHVPPIDVEAMKKMLNAIKEVNAIRKRDIWGART